MNNTEAVRVAYRMERRQGGRYMLTFEVRE